MKVKLIIRSENRHFGASPIKDSQETALAIKKAKQLLKGRAKGNSSKGSDADSKSGPLEYGTHDGSTHSKMLGEFEGTIDEIASYLDNCRGMINTFRNLDSVDLASLKSKYSDEVLVLTREYSKKYGRVMPKDKSIEFTNKCAEKSFNYYRHQIIIQLIGTEDEFAESDRVVPYGPKDSGLFICENRVKSVISFALLTKDQLDAIEKGSDVYIKATSRDVNFKMALVDTPKGMKYIKKSLSDLEVFDEDSSFEDEDDPYDALNFS